MKKLSAAMFVLAYLELNYGIYIFNADSWKWISMATASFITGILLMAYYEINN